MREDEIRLPERSEGKMSLEDCIVKRRSQRSFSKKELTLAQISSLLWACQGITDSSRGFRSVPSAGALYPLEVSLVKKDGIFRYIPQGHRLKRIKTGDHRRELCQAALNQSSVREAPVNIVFSAIPERTTWRYGERGMQYIWIEVGHAAQNLHLAAVSMGLGSVPIGAFYDEKVKTVLSLGDNELPLYIVPVGYSSD